MHPKLLLRHAKHVSPEVRLSSFFEVEERLTWTSLLLQEFDLAEVFLVGGSVRDILLGKHPKDIDLVIRGVEIEDLKSWLRRHGAAELVGRFGTFKFVPHGLGGTEPIDIALPRTEHIGEHHKSGRTDMEIRFDPHLRIQDDLARRDFTINAMAFDLDTRRLIDPYFGAKALKAGIVEAVLDPKERFYEDATRILRGLRFASQLHFAIEERTWEAMQSEIMLLNARDHDEEGHVYFVTPREAIGREFLKGYLQHPAHTVELWHEAGALNLFFKELPSLDAKGLNDLQQVLDRLEHPHLKKSFDIEAFSPSAKVAALFAPFYEEEAHHAICRRLYFHQFSKKSPNYVDCDRVNLFLRQIGILEQIDPANMRPSQFESTFCHQHGTELLALTYLLALHGVLPPIVRDRVLVAKRRRIQMMNAVRQPKLISGSDLVAHGFEPGPEFRDLLATIRDAQLRGEIGSKDEALHLLK
jgi:tRNA nucleotidyltransferase/poly(A) polymerase